MNDAALRTFISIIETGSLVRASQQLHVTQSTVTARLKTLEDEMGQQLLNRHKSGTTLTPAGTRAHFGYTDNYLRVRTEVAADAPSIENRVTAAALELPTEAGTDHLVGKIV